MRPPERKGKKVSDLHTHIHVAFMQDFCGSWAFLGLSVFVLATLPVITTTTESSLIYSITRKRTSRANENLEFSLKTRMAREVPDTDAKEMRTNFFCYSCAYLFLRYRLNADFHQAHMISRLALTQKGRTHKRVYLYSKYILSLHPSLVISYAAGRSLGGGHQKSCSYS